MSSFYHKPLTKMRSILLILSFIQISHSKIEIPETKLNSQIKCLFDLHMSSFEANFVIQYFPNTKQKAEEFLHLSKKLNQTMQIVNFNGNENRFTKVPHKFLTHILLISSVDEFQYFLKKMYGTAIWNAAGKYIVAYFGKEDSKDVLKMLQSSWVHYVININIILPSLQTLTYFPYSPASSCGTNIRPTSLGLCNTIRQPFPTKIPQNLNQCPIRAIMNLYPPYVLDPSVKTENAAIAGFDLTILNSFVRSYNMSSTAVGFAGAFAHFTNGKYGGSLKYIAENMSDVAFGTLYPNVSFFIDLDASLLYHYVYFNWVVPRATLGEQWKNLVLIFDYVLWTVILVILCCNMVIWCIFGRIINEQTIYKQPSSCVLYCWYSFLQGSITLPKYFVMRLLVIFWVFFTLLLATLYQSQLLSILLTPVYGHQISNAKELLNSKVITYVPNSFYVRLNNSARTVDNELFKKTVLVTYDDLAIITSKYSDNAGFLGNKLTTLYFMPRNYSSEAGRQMMYMCKDEEFGNPITMYFRKGYPLVGLYNRWLQHMLDAGLVSKWLKDATYFVPRIRDEDGPKKFSLNQLSGAFFVLCLGLGGSALIFIMEWFYCNCVKKVPIISSN